MSCRMSLLYTRLLAGQTRPIFNSVIVKEVCACESPEEYAPKSARAMNKSRGQRGTTYGDGAYLKIESGRKRDGKERAENARIVKSQFILVPKRIGAGHRDRASIAASRSERAGRLILENPLPIRINYDFLEAWYNPAWSDDACL